MANTIENDFLPKLKEALAQWRRRVVWSEAVLWGLIAAGIIASETQFHFLIPLASYLAASPTLGISAAVALFLVVVFIHFKLRGVMARQVANLWRGKDTRVAQAVLHNNRWWHPLFSENPRGWGKRTLRQLNELKQASKRLIQKLNDQFAAPSGGGKTEGGDKPTQDDA